MEKIKFFGRYESAETYALREFLRKSVIDFDWIDLNDVSNANNSRFQKYHSAIQFTDGRFLTNPTIEDVAKRLGWVSKPARKEYDLSIYGAGPAGLSAAVYAASEGLSTILIEKEAIGGQAGTSSLIENYMGFPQGISGTELAERARQQAVKFGVEILLLQEGIKGYFANNRIYGGLSNGEQLIAKANICATGVEYAALNVPNEKNFFNRGLYYGAGMGEACF